MCGIISACAQRDIVSILAEGLERLAYRGYDSAGIAVINDACVRRVRAEGKVDALLSAIKKNPLSGMTGIAHTRWATHGVPSESNAHPHTSHHDIALVHNGIIENYKELRDKLSQENYVFSSETDTEVAAHLLHFHYQRSHDFLRAMQDMLAELLGAYSVVAIHADYPHRLLAARRGSPLVLGIGGGENFVASDPLAFASVTKKACYLEDGDIADVSVDRYLIYNKAGEQVDRAIQTVAVHHSTATPGEYRHFMQKEIFEQPDALNSTLEGRLYDDTLSENIFGVKADVIFSKVKHIQIVACGTSYYAGLTAAHWFESLSNISCSVEVASEFRYRKHVVRENSLLVCVSQSGETADTLAALRYAKDLGYMASLAVCNVPHSSLVRETDLAMMTRAGVEVGVASTKAFTAQLLVLLLLSLTLAKALPAKERVQLVRDIKSLPRLLENLLLSLDKEILSLSEYFVEKNNALFLGRGVYYPIALEGALKLKEVSYIHAEAYPAGELKHGPLALIDRNMPVIAVAPNDKLFGKLRSNLQEVRARKGELVVFTDSDIVSEPGIQVVHLPTVPDILAPLVYVVPLQLLAYHVGVLRGTDVDKPRNLAKSVTVE